MSVYEIKFKKKCVLDSYKPYTNSKKKIQITNKHKRKSYCKTFSLLKFFD